MGMVICCAIASVWLSLSAPQQNWTLMRVEGTNPLELTGGFRFTISPDDRWLVFFDAGDPTQAVQPGLHYLYARLRVIDLRSGKVHPFNLLEAQVADSMDRTVEASWAPDSSMCLLPPWSREEPLVVIDFEADQGPRVSFLPRPRTPRKPGEPLSEQIRMPDRFTCSDCPSHSDDVDLLKKHIPEEFQSVGTGPTLFAHQAVSPDRKKVFYQQRLHSPENQSTTLFEIDVETGKQRLLTTHLGERARIDELRPSPDGKRLAYQVTTGGNFASIPEIHVLDLASGTAESIALGGGSMHWSSTSDRLYFYRRWLEGEHGDYLWVAELDKSAAPQTQPAAVESPAAKDPSPDESATRPSRPH